MSCEPPGKGTLQVYLLGSVPFETVLALQRRLAYQVAGDREQAVLILCEHPPLVTVGRQGSRTHILCDDEELRARRLRVRWVNRGGGCLLHGPGQLNLYPILPLHHLGLGVRAYLDQLHAVLTATLDDFMIHGESRPKSNGVWVGSRPIAVTGVAVRDWVSYYGAALNLNPDLEPFRLIRWCDPAASPMTSLERERHGAVRTSMVRERLIEHFATQFEFTQTALFFEHPALYPSTFKPAGVPK